MKIAKLNRISASMILVASCTTAALAVEVEDNQQAVMRFHNNDEIAGKLTALGDESLTWESDILAEPATFNLEHVLNLTLNAEDKSPEAAHIAILTLKNGDEVHGQLKDITDDYVEIQTWFAGAMKFNRVMIDKVQIEGGGSLHYRGPTSLDGWHQTVEDAWEYKRQSFISEKAGSIARDKVLPEQCSISFVVERKSDQIDLKMMIFSDDIESSRPRSGYELSFQRSSIYLRSGKTRNFLGSDHSRELSQNDKAKIEIRASRKTGKVVLLINDRITEVWSDPGVQENAFGEGLHFVAGSNQKIRISEIEIGPWDGKVEHFAQPRGFRHRGHMPQPDANEDKEEDKEGRMMLANGDSLEGEVSSVEEGLITLETSLGKIKLPVERLRSLNLEGLGIEEAKKENKDIRAYFADGSTLVFRLDQVEGDKIIGSSQNFSTQSKWGTAAFKLSAINRIEFDIHKQELKSLRASRDW